MKLKYMPVPPARSSNYASYTKNALTEDQYRQYGSSVEAETPDGQNDLAVNNQMSQQEAGEQLTNQVSSKLQLKEMKQVSRQTSQSVRTVP